MYVKFDESGKLESYSEVERLEEIRPDSTGFEPLYITCDRQDIYYLVKRNGIIQLDLERKHEDLFTAKLIHLREQRAYECFSVINRGCLWYDQLTPTQKEELRAWYQNWLDVTVSLTVPQRPQWLK